jgi:hypothetical protein
VAILSECGDEIGMHGQFLPLGAISASRAETLLSCIAGCSGVSGRGYYTAGPILDVQDVLLEVKPSFCSARMKYLTGSCGRFLAWKVARKLTKAVRFAAVEVTRLPPKLGRLGHHHHTVGHVADPLPLSRANAQPVF